MFIINIENDKEHNNTRNDIVSIFKRLKMYLKLSLKGIRFANNKTIFVWNTVETLIHV